MVREKGHDIRIIKQFNLDPALSMAYDEIMTEIVERDQVPVLRLYTWSPKGLTVGVRQNQIEFDIDKAHKDGVTVLKRHTGGTGILAGTNEVNYTLIVPKSIMEITNSSYLFCYFCTIIREAVERLGIVTDQTLEDDHPTFRNADCFMQVGQCEITTEDHRKLHGGAFANFGHTYLQQGHMPLDNDYRQIMNYVKGQSSPTQMPTSLSETLGKEVLLKEIYTYIESSFNVDFNVVLSDHTEEETNLAKSLGDKYKII